MTSGSITNDPVLVSELFNAVSEGDLEHITKLISLGVSPNAKNSNGDPVIESVFQKVYMDSKTRESIINYLILQGADINVVDGLGMTYLHQSVGYNFITTTKLLLDKGVDPNIKSKLRGEIALFSAKSVEMAELLLARKAGNINSRSNDGDTLLHKACDSVPSFELVVFYSQSIPIDATNWDGDTPLIIALEHNYFLEEREKIIYYLIDHGAGINVVGRQGRTPLMVAIQNEELDKTVIETLIEKGAHANTKS